MNDGDDAAGLGKIHLTEGQSLNAVEINTDFGNVHVGIDARSAEALLEGALLDDGEILLADDPLRRPDVVIDPLSEIGEGGDGARFRDPLSDGDGEIGAAGESAGGSIGRTFPDFPDAAPGQRDDDPDTGLARPRGEQTPGAAGDDAAILGVDGGADAPVILEQDEDIPVEPAAAAGDSDNGSGPSRPNTPVGDVVDWDARANSVSETAEQGDSTGIRVGALDPDSSDVVRFSLVDDADGRFAIDARTGEVTVAEASLLDYESATRHDITVRATSSDGSTSTQVLTIDLSDDTNEHGVGAVTDSDPGANMVSEAASDGAAVGITAQAMDADAGATISYSLSDDAGGRFTIDASTGVVTVADASLLDHESAASHEISIRATSSDGSTSTQVMTVNLADDTSEASVGAIADSDAAVNSVSESASNGTAVGITASASDADGTDSVSYSLIDDAGGRFTINPSTGVVTVADTSLLDYESATSHDITVKATSSDDSTSTQVMSVNLSDDRSEAGVSPVSDSDAAANTVSESTSNGTAVGITARASDADATDTISYSLSDDAGGRFAIDANTGVVTVADASLLDYESAPSHDITVKATSSDGSTSTQVMSINLTDDTSEAGVGVISDSDAAANSVSESASDGTAVGVTASASDADGTDTVSYSLSDDAGGRFTINASTGVITVADASLLDYESATSHDITVKATSSDGSTSTQVMSINLADDTSEASVGAVSDSNASANTVSESASNGTAVGVTASASDADSTDTVSYSLSDDAGGRFTINASTGVVTVADASLLDYESATSHDITVKATSSDGSTSTQVMTVNLTDDSSEASVGAVSDSNASANTVSESASNGTAVGITASASDADATDTISYSLSDDAGGRFTINTSTGVVTVADASLLDYESATSHDITVKATSSDGSTSTQVMTVNLTDDSSEASVGAVSDSNLSANTVSESASNGTAVGITASASDADATDTVSYSLSDDAGGRFTINTSTGVVTVADTSLLDYESATSHDITVKATSSDGSTSTQVMSINLTDDTSEASVGAVSDSNASANSVSESASNGTAVGITASASDADSTDTVSYSLSDDAGGRFTINASTGVVTVADASLLDYESATSHDITVKATSSDGSTSTQVMSINLTDDTSEASVGAVSDSNASANSVSESASNGTAVGVTASASDADSTDTVSYSLSDDAGGRFTINASTGVVTVADASLLDYESATSHDITVKATSSDGSTSTQVMTVNLTDDTSEASVGAVSDSNVSANTVSESASNGTAVGVTASASDADATDTVSYSLTDDAGGRFTINTSTGVVTVADASLLDYESATSHDITVKATSSDGSTSTQVMTINLTDDTSEASVGAVRDSNVSANSVSESALNGTAVGVTASASDADATDTVSYSLSDDAGGRFTINTSTGVVTVADTSLLDYESATSHDITVKATSSDGSTSTQVMTINLENDNSEAAVSSISDSNPSANSVSESASNGAAVGITASASDADAGDTVSYSLSDDAGGRFTINASTGVVTVADASLLDYESATSHDVTVKATSSDGSTSTQVMTINLTDDTSEASVGAISDSNVAANSVSESASNGTAVGITASASDADATDTVSYSLSDDAGGRFTINASTGVVTVADNSLLDYESATSHDITVKATSSDGSTSTQVLTINLTDDTSEASVGAVSDSNAAANSVSESASNGTAVGITASASDADGTDTVSYSLSDDAGGRFTVNASTGVVTVADTSLLDYESATSHDITVKATSSDGSTSTQVMTVNLTDDTSEASVGAVSDSNASADSVSESAANGTAVGITASASDADATDTVSYSLSDDAGGRFTINASTGVVTVADASLLDYESTASHDITVKATSSDGSTSTQAMTVNLSDDTSEASVGAVSDSNVAANSVSESASNGSAVGITASASDADGTDTVSYSLSDDAGGRFTINASTGVVTVADTSLLDYESATSHDITVKATSSDGSTSTQVMSVNLSDDTSEASVGAISDSNVAANSVSESASNGTAVGITASASDADATDTVSYSLSDDAGGRFTINSSTGVVTVADASLLDYESATSHDVTVKATSSDGSTSTQVMTINLSDDTSEASVGAVSDSNASANTVSESVSNGTAVGITASASDADGTDTVSYSLSDDAGGRFTINAGTGVVTVADTSLLDYESATSHDITVKATSSDGSTSTQVMSINLTDDTSEASVGAVSDSNASANSVSESASNGTAVGITASASDADATDTVSYSLSDDAGGRFTINASTGVVSVADTSLLDYESATSHDITVTATSSDGSTSTQVMSINLTDDTSEASVGSISDSNVAANSVAESASNGTAVGITASASDADATDTVSYSLSDDAGGRFTINASTGVVTVADTSLLDYESATSHDITVKATSSDGSTSTQVMTVNLTDDTSEASVGAISDSNVAANSVSESASNGMAVGITASASDADGTDTVSYSLSDDAGGRFTINASTGVVTVADASLLDYESTTSHDITVKATSSDGSTSTQVMTVNLTDDTSEAGVGAVSDSNASANSVPESTSNGTAVGITASASDADATDTVSYSLSDDAGGRFTINASTGVVTVADASLLDYESATSHDITVKATSSDGSTSTQVMTVNLTDDTSEASVGAVSDSNVSANSVSESASNGTAVGITASASDADGSDTVSYSLSDDAGGRFTVNASTGVVTVADTSLLDYESATSHDITVKATSSDGSTSTQVMTINLTDDTSEASVGAVSDSNVAANSVSESASNGTAVGITAGASDADATDTVSYSLSDDAGGRFTINASTGVVTVADTSLLDYESATSHDITVKATSSDGSTSTQVMTVNLTDDTSEASVGAVSDSNVSANSVSESASNGTAVGITASASDADATDTVSYSLSDDAGGRFTINASTGVITVADTSLLDYESATSHDITVKATSSDGSTSTQVMAVNLTDDTSEASVGAVSDSNAAANSVSESASNGAAVGITASASDADGTDTVSYSLSNDAGGRFTINASTGVVTVADTSLLDYESATSHDITVKATSSDGSTSTQVMTVNLSDDTSEASVGAISDSNVAANSVSESTSNGTAVGITASASDADTTDTVSYSLSDDAGGRFTINASTGVVTVANSSLLDYESATSHDITVKATSSDGSTSTQVLTVNLTDDTSEASVGAISDSNASANSVSETTTNGTAVGITASASDADGTDSVSYSLIDNAGGRFAINASTGVVTVADASLLDYESATSHNITVKATSSDGSTSTQVMSVNLTDDTDEFDIGAVSDSNVAANSVSESASNGTAVGITASATDADAGATVSYSLTDSAGGRFAINASTGVVTVANSSLLDYESATSHDITVKATSSDGSTSTETFSVNLSDANDHSVGSISDSNGSANTISETAADGSAVGITASASDADASDSVTYSLTDDAGGRFAINASTGVVTVADNDLFDYNSATSHDITVKATSTDGSTSTQSFTVNLTENGQYLYGDGGNNYLYGGAGNDNLYSGNAAASGSGAWDDYLSGGDGNDKLYSGTGDDRHYGGSGNDSLYGGDGYDTLYGGDDDDIIEGGRRNDSLYGNMGNDSLSGGSGDDFLAGDATSSNYNYSASELAADHDDTLDGGKGSDFITGHLGNDSIIGGSGKDTAYGGDGNDILDGGKGSDKLYGDAGNDTLSGGSKKDSLYGGDDNDHLYGGGSKDKLYGGSGNDYLDGGDKDDSLYGGDGNDTFSYTMGDDNDYVYGGAGGSWTDVIKLESGVGTYGDDWTVHMDSGSITATGGDYLELSNDAEGWIGLSDGKWISFEGIERIEW